MLLFETCSLFCYHMIPESLLTSRQGGPWLQAPRALSALAVTGLLAGPPKIPFFARHFQKGIKIISLEVIGPENHAACGHADSNTEEKWLSTSNIPPASG